MSTAFLLLPDFLLIVCGWAVCRGTPLDRRVWDAVEKLVYYLLFPLLLFNSIAKSPLAWSTAAHVAAVGVATVASGVILAYAVGRVPGVDARRHASGAQVAFRFNSYIALALAERLAGSAGVAWIALLVALCVPICNVAAVWPLARHGGQSYLGEIVRNPLIVGTLAGLAANALGVVFPGPVATTMQRIGGAALPLGLMTVGAGLQVGGLKAAPGLAAAFLAIRHAVLPAIAVGLGAALGLPSAQRTIVVAFAALPTASSCYVLAARMGGDAGFTAGLVTVSTLLGMVGLPLWLTLAAP